jgi:hypothetical protein
MSFGRLLFGVHSSDTGFAGGKPPLINDRIDPLGSHTIVRLSPHFKLDSVK